MSEEAMAAKHELIRQATRQAEALERAPAGEVCENHGDLAKGAALSLRLLIGIYERKEKSVMGMLAGIGVPTPVCALIYLVGSSRGWW